jgi:urea transport system permease protein
MRRITLLLLLLLAVLTRPAWALDGAAVEKLALGDSDEKIAAISSLVAEADPRALVVLEALAAGELRVANKRVLIVSSGEATDAVTGAKVAPLPDGVEDVSVNNRLRSAVQAALAAFGLTSTDRDARAAAVKELAASADEAVLPLVLKALAQERDAEIKSHLSQIAATLQVKSGTREERLSAVRALAASDTGNTRTTLSSLFDSEKDVEVRT